ncbi:MAG: S-methyl-5-thioribose-1-phosphate isomerase [Terriglobia bacterium]
MLKPIAWTARGVVILDQRELPAREVYRTCTSYIEVADAIKRMVIRGAPAIGVAAAMGIALGVQQSSAKEVKALAAEFETICDTLAHTRPTAVNLFWAINRVRAAFRRAQSAPARTSDEATRVEHLKTTLVEEARKIHSEDIAQNEALGRHGAALLPARVRILTHCNAGALATGGFGTALGVVRTAVQQRKQVHVLVPETRPYLQGARLTTWELQHDAIPTTLITDSMVGHFLKMGQIDCVLVGADRIAANGDTANKIGTYTIAVLAREHQVPFYVAAPFSSIDLSLPSGEHIPIEERSADEVTHIGGVRIAPENIPAAHPAFDVTPARYITAIITERGLAHPPYEQSLAALAASAPSFARSGAAHKPAS